MKAKIFIFIFYPIVEESDKSYRPRAKIAIKLNNALYNNKLHIKLTNC